MNHEKRPGKQSRDTHMSGEKDDVKDDYSREQNVPENAFSLLLF